jgi:hypothetical protein
MRGVFIIAPNLIAAVLNSLIVAGSLWFLLRVQAQTVRGRAVVLFIWAIVFFPWLEAALIMAGLYPPRARVPNEMLLGAALFDVFRTLYPLVLIVWLSFSKPAKDYLHAKWRAPSLFDEDSPFHSGQNG